MNEIIRLEESAKNIYSRKIVTIAVAAFEVTYYYYDYQLFTFGVCFHWYWYKSLESEKSKLYQIGFYKLSVFL
jgi:hypothetical protein